MKIVITGHTSGVGKYLHEYYTNLGHEVIGMSRSNGYDILNNRDRVINDSLDCNLFINNASDGDSQLELLKKLCTKIPNIVTMGSAGTDFVNIWSKQYTLDKIELEKKYKIITLNPNIANTLLIKLSFAETTYSRQKTNRIDSDFTITYLELAKTIDFWLANPKIRQIDYAVKLTDFTINQFRSLTGKNDLIDELLLSIDNLILK
jgi:hypothetical protein